MASTADSSNPDEPLSSEERKELEKLRKQDQDLDEERSAAPQGFQRWGRTLAAVVLIVLGCALVPLSVTSVWAHSMVTDTNRYVDTVAPLAKDPAVQDAITADITRRIFTSIDIKDLTNRALTGLADRSGLPPDLAAQLPALSGPISTGIENFTTDQVRKVVQSEAFAQAWEAANRAVHEQLADALTGKSNSLTIKEDTVSVNLAPIIETVKQRLVASGFQLAEKIPAVQASFVIYESNDVGKIQKGFNLLNKLGFWLPIICVILIGLGIFIARNHRRAFIGAGIGVALAMLAVAIALQVVRSVYLDSVPTDVLPANAAAVLYDTLVSFLREAIRAGVLLGLIVAAGAFLAGPSVTATWIRRMCVRGIAAIRRGLYRIGLHTERVTAWVATNRKVLEIALVVLAFLILFLVTYRTPALVVWLTVGVLVGLFIIQLLATPVAATPSRKNASTS